MTVGADDLADLYYQCASCGQVHALDELVWRCGRCEGVLDLYGFTPRFPPLPIRSSREPGMWRYGAALPLSSGADLSMGEGATPLVGLAGHPGVALKLDYIMPTGSFKDRGAVLLAALGKQLGAGRMLIDSSGNAGASLAAYAARAGVPCDVYVPGSTSPAKVGQLEAYGAIVHGVAGSRADTANAAAVAATQPDVLYASHVYNPLFFHGTKTYVLELWETLGGRLPDVLLLPLGNGTLVLGAYLGASELFAQGLIAALPKLVGVQAAACAPLAMAFRGGGQAAQPLRAEPTIAEGIAIAEPPRRQQVLSAVKGTGGEIVTVTEDQISAAHAALARLGFYVEPTSAVCFAAFQADIIPGPDSSSESIHTVIPLCGSGLKAKPPCSQNA